LKNDLKTRNGVKNLLAFMGWECLKFIKIYYFPLIHMSYVVASKIKDLVKTKGMMSSGDLSDAASKLLEDAVAKAVARAKANGRKTVRPEDL